MAPRVAGIRSEDYVTSNGIKKMEFDGLRHPKKKDKLVAHL